MPWEVFRFYKHAERPSLLLAVSVLLDDDYGRLPEPVLCAYVFDFGLDRTVPDFHYWLCSIHKVMPDREPDGTFKEAAKTQIDPDWHAGYEQVWCLTRPLVDLQSESQLRNEVIQTLCDKARTLHER